MTFESLKAIADQHFKGSEFEKAILVYESVLSSFGSDTPDMDKVFFNTGLCYAKQRNFPKALELYSKAYSLNAHHSKAYYQSAVCLLELGKFDEAYQQFLTAAKTDPSIAKLVESKIKSLKSIAVEKSKEINLSFRLKDLKESLVSDFEVDFLKVETETIISLELSKIEESHVIEIAEILETDDQSKPVRIEKLTKDIWVGRLQSKLNSLEHLQKLYNKTSIKLFPKSSITNDTKKKLILSLFEWEFFDLELDSISKLSIHLQTIYFQNRRIPEFLSEKSCEQIIDIYEDYQLKESSEVDSFWQFLREICLKHYSGFSKYCFACLSKRTLRVQLELCLLLFEMFDHSEENKQVFRQTVLYVFSHKFFDCVEQSVDAKDLQTYIKIAIETLQNSKTLELLGEEKASFFEIFKRILSLSNSRGLNSKGEALLKLLFEYNEKHKVEFDPSLALSLSSDLFRKSETEGTEISLKLLVVLVREGKYLVEWLKNDDFLNFLQNVPLRNSNERLLFCEVLFGIGLHTKEEKIKHIKQNYSIQNSEQQSLEKYLEMGNASVLKTISESDLLEAQFFKKMQEKKRIDTVISSFFEEKKVLSDVFLKDLFRFILKLIRANKNYAVFYNNTSIFEFLQKSKPKWLCNENQILSECLFPFAACMVSGLEISQILYRNLPIVIELICCGLKSCESELSIFEALLGLTRIVGEQPVESNRVWNLNNMKSFVWEHIISENEMISCAALELFLNCVVDASIAKQFCEKEEESKLYLSGLSSLINGFDSAKTSRENRFGSYLYTSNLLLRIIEYLTMVDQSDSLKLSTRIDKQKWAQIVSYCHSDISVQERYKNLLKN